MADPRAASQNFDRVMLDAMALDTAGRLDPEARALLKRLHYARALDFAAETERLAAARPELASADWSLARGRTAAPAPSLPARVRSLLARLSRKGGGR